MGRQVATDSPRAHQVATDSPKTRQVFTDSPRARQVAMDSPRSRQVASDSPKAEVGEIDTRAPFASVRAALSLFGKGAASSEKSPTRKPKSERSEKLLAEETQLHLALKELKKLKEQLRNAEKTRVQALNELDCAKKTVEVLTHELNTINKSKELALEVTEVAKGQTKQTEEISSHDTGKDGAWKQDLDTAREHYAAAVTELDAAKQELRRIRKDYDASMDVKISAFQQEYEAKQLSGANSEKANQLLKEIATVQESIMQVKLATEQTQQEESKIRSERDTRWQSYRLALEEYDKKLASLKKEFAPQLIMNLEAKLAETTAEIQAIQKELEDARVSTELDAAKGMLLNVAEEENSLKTLVESLKLELETVNKEQSELKEKDADVDSAALQAQLQKCKAELETALAVEAKAVSASDGLASTLQQLSAESEAALREAETMKQNANVLRDEAEAARVAFAEAEKKLQATLSDAEEAKSAESRALNQIRELSEKANACRSSTSEHGAKITISSEEYESLSRKVEESEKLAEMKVAAAMAQVEAVRSSDNETIKRLEATLKEIEDMKEATEESMKSAEMAEAAKKIVEGELRKWSEKEQKAAETASPYLAETQMYKEQSPRMARVPTANTLERSEVSKKVSKPFVSKSTLLPSLSSIFQRRKNHAD